ncbi:MAG TPA: PP2C family protein-serine/threonine phosphatase [Blastocatellia bacterium]|nr:PP2C family protein-serine/threonine phosphatase [Blastocatellia bacterium]
MAISRRDKLYLLGFLLGAGILLFLGRDLLQSSIIVTYGLTFGGTTAAAVLLAVLYRLRLELKASRHELARKEAELNFALEVQRALFPSQLPLNGGLEFAAICIPARGISGDYYDVMELPDGRIIFAIADISGKGISAAILMANLQAVMRTLAQTGKSPKEICSSLNYHLHQVTDAARFATFFYAEWDISERRLTYINAGHHMPIITGSCTEKLDKGGLPLGILPNYDYQVGEIALQPGDLMVLYSDGITEASNIDDVEFGEKRLAAIIDANCSEPLPEIQRRVLLAVQEWSGDEQEDDMTLLLMRATLDKEER